MITQSTVFVLGAGASKHLDFPTAHELRKKIIRISTLQNASLLKRCDFSEKDIEVFRSAFQSSGLSSIDSFLELRPEFEKIGKAAIACVLVPKETPEYMWRHTMDTLFVDTPFSNWYEYLFNLLRVGVKDLNTFWQNNVFFITFNYDRSLQHYLASCVQACFKADYYEAVNELNPRVLHVHGSLAPLGKEAGQREYKNTADPELLKTAASSIRVLHESHAPDFLTDAHSRLQDAAKVFFLGFGYDPANLAKLLLPRNRKYGGTHGTCWGLEPGEKKAIQKKFYVSFVDDASDLSIEKFLRNVLPLAEEH